jgi:CheY-like chemotaxis protein
MDKTTIEAMPKRVLLIDDDTDDAEVFADVLKEIPRDFDFYHFSDGREALTRLQQTGSSHPDIIFLDINMPIVDGWECLRKIKELANLANIPIIMYSTANLVGKDLQPGDVGATAFLTKPDSFGELREKLTRLFESILPTS